MQLKTHTLFKVFLCCVVFSLIATIALSAVLELTNISTNQQILTVTAIQSIVLSLVALYLTKHIFKISLSRTLCLLMPTAIALAVTNFYLFSSIDPQVNVTLMTLSNPNNFTLVIAAAIVPFMFDLVLMLITLLIGYKLIAASTNSVTTGTIWLRCLLLCTVYVLLIFTPHFIDALNSNRRGHRDFQDLNFSVYQPSYTLPGYYTGTSSQESALFAEGANGNHEFYDFRYPYGSSNPSINSSSSASLGYDVREFAVSSTTYNPPEDCSYQLPLIVQVNAKNQREVLPCVMIGSGLGKCDVYFLDDDGTLGGHGNSPDISSYCRINNTLVTFELPNSNIDVNSPQSLAQIKAGILKLFDSLHPIDAARLKKISQYNPNLNNVNY